jgi:hypothetical protein
MSSDANIVASLNPGLAMRSLDDGIVSTRSPTSVVASSSLRPSQPVVPGPDGEAVGGFEITTGGHGAIGRASSDPVVTGRQRIQTPVSLAAASSELSAGASLRVKRSAFSTMAWFLLGLVVFGGVGAIVYVATGERSKPADVATPTIKGSAPAAVAPGPAQASPSPSAAATPTLASGGTATAPTPGSQDSATATDPAASADPGSSDATARDSKSDRSAKNGKRPKAGAKRPPSTAVADEKEADAILKRGKELAAQGKWEAAKSLYEKLEKTDKFKGYSRGGEVLYRKAEAFFNLRDYDSAAGAARRAAESGFTKHTAMLLVGDALFKKGEVERAKEIAKEIFLSLHRQASGDAQATLVKKIAACNKTLRLADGDGLPR